MKMATLLTTAVLTLSSSAHGATAYILDCGKTPDEFAAPKHKDSRLEMVLVQSKVDAFYGKATTELSDLVMVTSDTQLSNEGGGRSTLEMASRAIHVFEAPFLFKGKGDPTKSTGSLVMDLKRNEPGSKEPVAGVYNGELKFHHNLLHEVITRVPVSCTLRQVK